MIVIEPTALTIESGIPCVESLDVSELKPGHILTNVGVVESVDQDGVFITAKVRGTCWSLETGLGDIEHRFVTWHITNIVTIDVVPASGAVVR